MKPCPHPRKRIDGIWRMDIHHPPISAAWTCEECGTSGATKWADCTGAVKREAINAELSRASRCEMSVWRAGE